MLVLINKLTDVGPS